MNHNSIQTYSYPPTKTILLISLIWLLSSCNPSSLVTTNPIAQRDGKITNRITMDHVELRRDILAELQRREIQYWINEADSIGFPPADAEIIDSIYYEVVGAYAARN